MAELAQHADRDLGVVPDQLVKSGFVDLEQGAVCVRSGRRRPGQILEDRHFSEEIAFLENGEPAWLAVGDLDDLDLACLDDVHLPAGFPFAEDVVAGAEGGDELSFDTVRCASHRRAHVPSSAPTRPDRLRCSLLRTRQANAGARVRQQEASATGGDCHG